MVLQLMPSHVQVSADAGLHPMQTPEAARKLARDVMQLHAAAAPHLPAQEKPGSSQGSSKGTSRGAKGPDAAAEKLSSSVDALPPVAVGALLSTAFARGESLSSPVLPQVNAAPAVSHSSGAGMLPACWGQPCQNPSGPWHNLALAELTACPG